MKKQTYSIILCVLFLFLISLSVLAATPHQRPLTATEDNKLDNQQAADQNPEQPDQFTAADKQLIPFTVTSNPKTGKVEAKITDLQAAALDMGMDEMVIEGIQRTRTKPDGTKEVTILWTGAYKINPDNGKKITTSIQKPLDSKLIVKNKIVEGDSFNAEGNPLELIAAWKRLNAEQPVTPEKKKEGAAETNGANTQKTDTAGVPADTPPTPIQAAAPNFAPAPTPVVTTTSDGCQIKVDLAQMSAIVQEQTMTDGKTTTPCTETLTRYPINKITKKSCGLIFDTPNMTAYEMYILQYTDPKNGDIQVQDCTQDNDKTIQLVSAINGCGITHDFAAGISTQQESITYFYNGAAQILQSCSPSQTTYAHTKTEVGCTPTVTGENVIFNYQTQITVNGAIQTINPCTPDLASAIPVSEETCISPRYTNDFVGEQSFLNKNYYYMNNGARVDIATCIQSTTSFPHMKDSSVCTSTNDDPSKTTTVYAKTYIEEVAGTKIYLNSCSAVSPVVPYTANGNKWKINTSGDAILTLSANDLEQKSNIGLSTPGIPAMPHVPTCTLKGGFGSNQLKYCISGAVSVRGSNFCLTGALEAWKYGGVTISQVYSTASPTWVATLATSFSSVYGPTPIIYNGETIPLVHGYSGANILDYSCSTPHCQLTTLKAHPAYLRGDGTTYLETSTVLSVLNVCGDGANKDGQPYP